MSLLSDLRTDIGDDTGTIPTGILSPASCSLLNHFRLDISDDTPASPGTIQSGVNLVLGNLNVDGNLVVCGSQSWGRRIITASGNVTVQASDNIILMNKTVGAPTTVTVPAPSAAGCAARLLIIKDMKGDASTNNISIVSSVGTIDGFTTWVINQDYQAFTLVDNGTEWNII
jgi:hypothetical protein